MWVVSLAGAASTAGALVCTERLTDGDYWQSFPNLAATVRAQGSAACHVCLLSVCVTLRGGWLAVVRPATLFGVQWNGSNGTTHTATRGSSFFSSSSSSLFLKLFRKQAVMSVWFGLAGRAVRDPLVRR